MTKKSSLGTTSPASCSMNHEIEVVAEWWTNYFRSLLEKHREEGKGKLSLIPGLVGAALAERERMEKLASKSRSPSNSQGHTPFPRQVAASKPTPATLQKSSNR